MKASEVLKRYKDGETDFRRVSLRGQSFKRANLAGADFSEADIRGANFTNAYLRGAKFCGAKAGLQRQGTIFWLVILFLLVFLAGLSAVTANGVLRVQLTNTVFEQNVFLVSLVVLGLLLSFVFISVDKGISASLRALIGTMLFAGMVAAIGHTVEFLWQQAVVVWVTGIGGALAVAVSTSGVIAVTVVLAGTLAEPLTGFVIFAGALASGVTGAIIRVSTRNGIDDVKQLFLTSDWNWASIDLVWSWAFAWGVIIMGSYVGWRTLAEDKNFTWLRRITIPFGAIGGTSFYNADLTNADFSQAKLKSTDFRRANLTSTCFRETKKLGFVRPGTTYLQDVEVRQLLITGQGQDINFDHKDLRGVNLQGANLTDASFIGTNLNEANLQDADLSGAKLVQTQLDKTDFTGATLTGATIEDWGITSHTQLQGVRCRYVFMRLPTKNNPEPRRKPDNREDEFGDGDFTDFIKPMVDTLDLYHNQAVDPRALAISFKQLVENNPDAELEIVAMEKRGKDKFLLRAATAPDADHSKLNVEYFTTYNEIKALVEAEAQTLLAEKDSRISSLENMVETALKHPSFYTNTQVEQAGIMTNNPGGISQSNTGSIGGGQQAAIGNNNQQTMSTQAAASAGEELSQQDVLQLLAELEQRINESGISFDMKEEATTYLSAAKKAIDKEEPNKERAKINLEGVAEELEKASKVAEAGTTLFTKVKPILVKVAGWLGAVAAGSFLGTL
ncbi:MAG: hypothetical protein F6K47_36135 [Symploca sp. SIO2E6]|nr:hypothetical protein [Symploca sp. SIO2E6]